MSLLSRLIGKRPDDREAYRPLWHRVVEIARARGWYAQLGVEDSMPGRFDMVTLVTALVMLRMETDAALHEGPARLTELFVEDMDGQLRQSGIGDPTVGKHVRKLVTTLGGRLGALREAIAQGEDALVPVLERNMTVTQACDFPRLARAVAACAAALDATSTEDLLAARFAYEPQ